MPKYGKYGKIRKNIKSRSDLTKKIALCEEKFEESCFNKSDDLGGRLIMNSKHLFMFSLVFDLQYTVKSQKNLMSLFLDGGEARGGGGAA